MKYSIFNILFFLSFCCSFNSFSQSGNSSDNHTPHDTPPGAGSLGIPANSDGTNETGGCSDPVLVNGNWFNTETDIHYLLFGKEFSFKRTYNSMGEFDRSFGYGWSHNFDIHLLRQDNGDVLFVSEKGRTILLKRRKGGKEYLPLKSYCPRLSHNSDDTFQLLFEDGRLYNFNAKGNLIYMEGKGGNKTNFKYDENGFLIKINDPTERGFELTYNTSGKISQIKDHASRKVNYNYDEKNRLTEIILPDGLHRKYGYDKKGRLNSLTNQNGDSYKFFFDKLSRMTKNVDPRGNAENFNYPKFLGIFPQRKIVFKDKRGNQWISNYNASGKITKLTYPNDTQRKQKWDKYGNLIEIVYPNGTMESRKYDYRNNMIAFANKMGETTYFTYKKESNLVTSRIDPSGNKFSLSYDNQGNLISETDALGNSHQFTYNEFNQVLSITDPLGTVKEFAYDEFGNLLKIIFPGGEESFTYDSFGNILTVTDESKNTHRLEYDALNRPNKITNPLGAITKLEYGTTGEIAKMIDANGNETSYSYVVISGNTDINEIRKVSQIQTPTHQLNFAYDEIGNLTSFTDGENKTTTFDYNVFNLLVKESNPLGNSIQYKYDNGRNIIEKVNPNGKSIFYNYDKLGRLVQKTYDGNIDRYAYNPQGSIVSASNNNIQISRKYDPLQRLTEERIDSWNKTVQYKYDSDGNRISMTNPNNGITSYQYSNIYHDYHLTEIRNPFSEVTKFEYDAGGRIKKQTNANGTFTSFQFNKVNNLINLTNHLTEEKTASSFTYDHDKVGNRLSMEYADGSKDQYQYDQSYQVTGVNYGDGMKENYQYDLAGNRLALTENNSKTNYQYNPANQLLKAGNALYKYDKNGNLIEKKEAGNKTQYSYDGENKLTKIELSSGQIISFEYDALGRRVKKIYNNDIIKYVYDGINLLMELDNEGKTNIHYTTGFEIDHLISMIKDGQSYYYHRDGLGSVTGLSSNSQQLVNQYSYNVFGKLRNSKEEVANNLAYTGREIESESNLLFLRGRFYDHKIGRFINEDPIRYNGGTNLFAYTNNNPINFVDPFGLHWTWSEFGMLVTAGAGVAFVTSTAAFWWTGPGTLTIPAATIIGGIGGAAGFLIINTWQSFGNWFPNTGNENSNPFDGATFSGSIMGCN